MQHTDLPAGADIAPSVGTPGDAFDKAVAPSVIGLYKVDDEALADTRGGGVCHLGVGGLVQHAAVAGTDRRRAAGGVRSAVL